MMKHIGKLFVFLVAVGVGFFIRGMIPSGPPPGMGGGFGAMPPPAPEPTMQTS